MLASIWLRAAHRGAPTFLMTVLLTGLSPTTLAESPAQRQELVAALRQLDALERTVTHSAAHTAITPGERYHFDYPRLLADLSHVRAGIQSHLTPSRAQPRDPSELAGDYRTERPSAPPPTEGRP
ncbi:RAQPRD family plasmid [Pseudomonas sp. ABC1]|uniref:integrative conjugative element protein, RAQPRD family n=1 Tax=Pseudomonas sp. ABC1 TaxID=2748080 RepID=UPI0015C3B99C|nr:RAQPRD family integrative conjugative element protein [Pseudomonas sp. ABC1]QLF92092.1 RAQPRD family plasmid [Pseudomonas sp. ABC1]